MATHRMELVERVKVMQKSGCREPWAIYCDTYGNGTRDPKRHTEVFLTGFLTYIQGGSPPTGAYSSSAVTPDHVNEVKSLQRQGFRDDWATYCDNFGGGIRDPNRHDLAFCKRFCDGCRSGSLQQLFLDLHKQLGQYDMQCGFMGSFPVAPSMSVYQPSASAFPPDTYGNVYSGEQLDLVNQVKEMQRMGYREVWAQFCENSGNKTRDPARYDNAFLTAFTNYVQSGSSADRPMRPTAMEFPSYSNYMQSGAMHPVSGPGNQPLIDTVKSMQRTGFQPNWSIYCEQFGQRIRDPSRHPDEFLQRFVDNPTGPWSPELLMLYPHAFDMQNTQAGAVDMQTDAPLKL